MRLIRLLKNDLAREVSSWEKSKIISQAQAVQICQHYGIDYHQIDNRSFAYRVLLALGYLFIGLAVITLLSANWDAIPRGLRMAALIMLTMGTHAVAIKRYVASGSTVLFLLANLFYGASIILIAQIYHLGEHMPDGVFWWALGCLPLALILRDPWIMLQTLVLALIWFFLQLAAGYYAALFALFVAAGLYVLYYGKYSAMLFLLVVISIGCWIEYSLAYWWAEGGYSDLHLEHAPISVMLFIFSYAVSARLYRHHADKAKDYAVLLSIWSLRLGLLVLFVLSFAEPWREIIRHGPWHHLTDLLVLTALLSVAAIYFAWCGQKIVKVLLLLTAYWLTLLSVIFAPGIAAVSVLQIIYNLALVGTGVGLIVHGMRYGITHYYFLGVVTILITALLRYFDLIGDYIGGAILFAVFAAILLGAAKFWKMSHNNLLSHEA